MRARLHRAALLLSLGCVAAGSVAVAGSGAATAGPSRGGGAHVSGPADHGPAGHGPAAHDPAGASPTATPIKHLVVIFDENVSFDHYFGTYPYAANPPGEPSFTAAPGTPSVNGLFNGVGPTGPTGPLISANPNLLPSGAVPGASANPVRLDRSQAMTCDQDHGYASEQKAVDMGAMDSVILDTGHGKTLAQCLAGLSTNGVSETSPAGGTGNYAVMDYYDGNTVTALWNYAQHFAMSDNAYGTNYGPSTDGALNVTSANTYGALCGPSYSTINDSPCTAPPGYDPTGVAASTLTTTGGPTGNAANGGAGPGTDISDSDPYYDICSYLPSGDGGDNNLPSQTIAMGGPNIGTDLNAKSITWGWFEGGFDNGYVPGVSAGPVPTTAQACAASHQNVGGSGVTDYIPHHEPFQYYASTANPMHLPPTSVAAIGQQDQANHQYDLADFWAAADSGGLPAVSYLKAPAYQDGHAGYSDPLDEQAWLATTIDHLESLPSWHSTAVVVTWDDSDGWYDHVVGPLVSQSQSPVDFLTSATTGGGSCGTNTAAVPHTTSGTPEEGKCGVGPRLPFLVISPWARPNFVDNTLIDQSSIVSFIEANWGLPALGDGAADTSAGSIMSMFDFRRPSSPKLLLDPSTGEVVGAPGRA